ncbi:MAG: hypothetical protein UY23_C0001G0132 [Candidatus Jorgensenbacteria bacterium GW2011_GWA1_48_11]|uniref:Phage holin family protein n=1 Tax=Candidatus Jorgensenbacteria bacterium GW2011_GWA1_48_11 TaxID=1618660 RepID=A0A0G1UBI6_9BACT|nr:MAG: hypothetical protein UY23_C0001G0132 [Candidatus Jorgensenbacteria bacterium GW2011_GWA1_48_11]KKW12019.1 MAG: hypothetical protein UY51_C0005G0261 [Candidatus Jorgensenbacteria bacterium GW2011_GWB1_49_9]
MKFIGRFILHVISNSIAIWLAAKYIVGFTFSGTLTELLVVALALTLINTFIRPFIKIVLGPFVVLTFGLFTIVINAGMLYLLDIWSPALTIQGYAALLWATILIGLVNFVVGLGVKTLESE